MQGAIAAADPASKVAYTFSDPGKLHDAIKEYGFIPLMTSGQPFVVQEFEGGYLLGGAPINVHMQGVWYEGQRDLLEPYYAAGTIPRPPADVLNAPTAPMPQNVSEAYQAYKTEQAGGGLSSTLMIGLGGALLVYLLASGGKKGHTEAASDFL
jgi:hypothetical protein